MKAFGHFDSLIECINPKVNAWRVRWEISEGVYEEREFGYRPSLEQLQEVIKAWFNKEIDNKIISGFEWKEMPIWLSSENQFNYKTAYDLAVQTNGASLPIKFKFGTDESPVYYTFESLEDFSDFYMSAVAHVNTVLNEGWEKKDSIDWEVYK
jgi:hypothetical protein